MTEPAVAIPLALLLLVNIAWSIVLYRRLRVVETEGDKLQEFLKEFDSAIERAREAGDRLRQQIGDGGSELRRSSEAARLRSEQLGRLCEGAERLARRLELAIERAARARADLEVTGAGQVAAARDPGAREETLTGASIEADQPGKRRAETAPRSGRPLPPELEQVLARLR